MYRGCRGRRIYYKRDYGAWPQNWSKISTPFASVQKDSSLLLMKTIKNYPKTHCALHQTTKNHGKIPKHLLQRLVKKYKKDFFQHVILYGRTNIPIPLEFLSSRITSLCFEQHHPYANTNALALKKFISHNKRLKIFEQYSEHSGVLSTIKNLKYLDKLSSVCLSHLQYLQKQIYQRILFASSTSLETVTLKGKLDAPYTSKTSNLIELLEIVFQLPSLISNSMEKKNRKVMIF